MVLISYFSNGYTIMMIPSWILPFWYKTCRFTKSCRLFLSNYIFWLRTKPPKRFCPINNMENAARTQYAVYFLKSGFFDFKRIDLTLRTNCRRKRLQEKPAASAEICHSFTRFEMKMSRDNFRYYETTR